MPRAVILSVPNRGTMLAVQEGNIAPGTVLAGRYRVVRRLGAGGMGAVYEGLQVDLGRRVALKVLHPSMLFDRDAVIRFEREARAAAELGHPNIVQVTDFQWQNGAPILVMEYLSGRSLGDVLRAEKQIAPARACFIAAQVLLALDAAHRAGIVHRDIKPDNVFLVSMSGMDDLVKVVDFGVAKLASVPGGDPALTARGAMIGSPSFLAPEQARGLDVDHRADIYGVGVLLYFILSGRLPFEAAQLHQLVYAIVETPPRPLRTFVSVEPRLEAIVERAMAKDPGARFQSARDMREALLPLCVASSAVSFTGPVVSGAAAPPATRAGASSAGPVIAVVVILAVLLLSTVGAALAYVLLRAGRTPTSVQPTASASATTTGTAPPSSSPVAPPAPSSDGTAAVSSASIGAASASARREAPRPATLVADAGPAPRASGSATPVPSASAFALGVVTRVNCYIGDYAGFESQDAKNKMAARQGPITRCLATNPVPERQQNRGFLFFITTDAEGRVTKYEVASSGLPEDGPFQRCVEPTLRASWGPKEEKKSTTHRVSCTFPSR